MDFEEQLNPLSRESKRSQIRSYKCYLDRNMLDLEVEFVRTEDLVPRLG